jgi:integrase
MAWLRARKLKSGTYFYVVTSDGRYVAAGKQRSVATEILAEADRVERLVRAGKTPEPTGSDWTLEDLRDRDLQDARTRGKEIASRERRWRMILAALGARELIDSINQAVIEDFTLRRSKHAGPATVNRDRSLLRAALALARRLKDVSGYTGDPFKDLAPLPERASRRASVALPRPVAENLIDAAWELAAIPPKGARNLRAGEWAQNAAIVELIYRTASRVSQILRLEKAQVRDGMLAFPPHKGGKARIFEIPARVEKFLSTSGSDRKWVFPGRGDGPREGFRRFWLALCAKAKLSGVTPHALRHSAASIEFAAGKSIPDIQRLLGHGSPQMAVNLYAHVFPQVLKPIGAFHLGSREAKQKRAKRRKSGEPASPKIQRVAKRANRGSAS